MRYFAVLITWLLINDSSANKCCTNTTLDINSLVERYQSIVAGIAVPILEYGDQSGGAFKNATVKSIGDYGKDLLVNLHSQGLDAGEKLIDDIERDYGKLQHSIGLITAHHTNPIYLENALRNLTDRIETFLKLKPGISKFELPVLPPLPKQQIELSSRTTNLTAEEIFSNSELTIFSIAGQVFAYITYLFLTTWSDAGTIYETIRTQLYDEIINCPVLGTYRYIVDQVLRERYLIQCHVRPEIWKCFINAGDQIITISNNYCDSLKNCES